MSIINISEVSKLINENTIERVKELCILNNIFVKDSDSTNNSIESNSTDNRVLIANFNENVNFNNKNNEKTENDEIFKDDTEIEIENLNVLKNQANGIIFDKESKDIIAACQPKFIEVQTSNEICQLITKNSSENIRMEFCEDGTVMRLYNYNDIWYTSTTRCIDATTSFWSSNRSFDAMFWEIFDKTLLQKMDKTFTYVFILLHKENRIVVKHSFNNLVYISRINNKTLEEDYINHFRGIQYIKRPKYIEPEQFLEVSQHSTFDNKYKRGVLLKVYEPTKMHWTIYKCDFERYKLVKNIRGNVPQIRMRYLELLNKPESLELLEKIYGENHFMFTYIRVSLLNLVKTIYKLYIDSHIKHSIQVTEDNIYYQTLRQLHAQYKITNKPINFGDVQSKIYSLNRFALKKLLGWD